MTDQHLRQRDGDQPLPTAPMTDAELEYLRNDLIVVVEFSEPDQLHRLAARLLSTIDAERATVQRLRQQNHAAAVAADRLANVASAMLHQHDNVRACDGCRPIAIALAAYRATQTEVPNATPTH